MQYLEDSDGVWRFVPQAEDPPPESLPAKDQSQQEASLKAQQEALLRFVQSPENSGTWRADTTVEDALRKGLEYVEDDGLGGGDFWRSPDLGLPTDDPSEHDMIRARIARACPGRNDAYSRRQRRQAYAVLAAAARRQARQHRGVLTPCSVRTTRATRTARKTTQRRSLAMQSSADRADSGGSDGSGPGDDPPPPAPPQRRGDEHFYSGNRTNRPRRTRGEPQLVHVGVLVGGTS